MTEFGGDSFKIVASGQKPKFSASRHNLETDMLKDFRGKRGIGMNNPQGIKMAALEGQVYVKNNSGGEVAVGGVLGIDDVGIGPDENPSQFKSLIYLYGVTPTTADHAGKFVVLAQTLGDGQTGKAFIQDTFWAQVNIVTAGDKWCDVKDSDATQLQSGSSGSAQIIYPLSGTGKLWCLIRVGNSADDKGLHQGDIPQMITDEEKAWGPAQFGP